MPNGLYKERYLYNAFRGFKKGVDPRALKRGELSNAIDVVVDQFGVLRPRGAFTAHAAGTIATVNAIPLHGLFSFSTDRKLAGTETGEDWLAFPDSVNGEIDIYAFSTDVWTAAALDLGGTASPKATYYMADGGLRVSDANFGAANKPQLRLYLKKTVFPGTTVAEAIDEWLGVTAAGDQSVGLTKPNTALVIAVAANPTVTDGNLGIRIDKGGAGSGTWDGDYVFYHSYIYEGNQESLLVVSASTNFATADATFVLHADVVTGPTDAYVFHRRITGGRIYYALLSDTTPNVPAHEPRLLLDFDFIRGTRAAGDAEWSAWGDFGGAGSDVESPDAGSLKFDDPPVTDTYESLNGFSHELDQISFENAGDGWKTAVVVNRSAYVGHVKMKDENGELRTLPDAIIKSPPGKFDTFPITNIIEAAVRDGESIVKLETYADRILEFKERTLRVINASQDIEFLEDVVPNGGIKNPGASILTDFGVAWVNAFGCFLYNGERIVNLLLDGEDRLIEESDWRNFVTSASQVAYAPKTKRLYVEGSADSSVTPAGYQRSDSFMFDFISGRWFHHDQLFNSTDNSNFVIDVNGDAVYIKDTGANVAVEKLDEAISTVTGSELTFHEDDFGFPGVIKKCYEVLVVYRNNFGTSPTNDVANRLFFALDGSDSFLATNLTGTFLGNKTVFDIATFTFSTPVSFETIRFRIDPNTSNRIEIKAVIPTVRVLPFKAAT